MLGKELVNLHLMRTKLPTETKFDIQGSNIVESVEHRNQRLYINNNQFFERTKNVWNFYIGSYQVLRKWLKSRRNRELSTNEIEMFLQIFEIIKKTIEYMVKIDRHINL
jgi:hypothetical protein